MTGSRISTNLDFAKKGIQQGYLRLPHSSDESAYGWIPVPIVCLNNGDGSTVLLVAGNHGDEYEGQLTLTKLFQRLTLDDVQGRIIMLPAANYPAVMAGRRTSPIDGGNLNRSFPGDPDGTPTEILAHYIEDVLLAIADYVVDLHSGGQSLVYVPCALVCQHPDPARMRQAHRALEVFGAPVSLIKDAPQGGNQTLMGGAERKGVHYLGSELGGGGVVSRHALTTAEHGLARFLKEVDVLAHPLTNELPPPTELLEVLGEDYYAYADEEGVFEPAVDLGAHVEAGSLAGAIYFPDTPWRGPHLVEFQTSVGLYVSARSGARGEEIVCFMLQRRFVENPEWSCCFGDDRSQPNTSE